MECGGSAAAFAASARLHENQRLSKLALLLEAAAQFISAILSAVPGKLRRSMILVCVACGFAAPPRAMALPQATLTPQPSVASPNNSNTGGQSGAPQAQQNPPAQTPPAPPVHVGPTIVINPAHGGTDNGAQGQNGILEKDMVLLFAKQVRSEFERLGYRVVMTRNDDSNPSYEDRAAVANAYRDAIFISIHISSTGQVGTARAYSYQYSNAQPIANAGAAAESNAAAAPKGLVPWDQAQRPFVDVSHKFADLAQTQLALRFEGSPAISTAFAVRDLRSVSAPAIAVELSSVSVSDANAIVGMGAPLAAALVRSVQVLRPALPVSRNSPVAAPGSPQAAEAN